ncbi:tryptase beta-2 [Lepeophtheirus salmonis]|uniref:tryptase beta-2 n=1 Tax=Lepeophtheirus salmonis TaxID=72036 RepID=UPI001AE8E3A8|nr:tryptase beta-2-like [Lepeophtheirus salmonis]
MWIKNFIFVTTYVSLATSFSTVIYDSCGYSTSKGLKGCKPRTSNRIINGVGVEEGDIPWQVAIKLKPSSGPSFWCGGTIISESFVITAAHCLKDRIISGINIKLDISKCYVYAGGNLGQETGVQYNFSMYIMHPSFKKIDGKNIHDIGLVQIKGSFDFSSVIQPACLPFYQTEPVMTESSVVVSGWGRTDPKVDLAASRLMRADLYVKNISSSICKRGKEGVVDPDSLLCIWNPPSSGCFGDSGGPVTLEESGRCILVGVISQGVQCGATGQGAINVKVSYYLDWIYSNIMKLC